MNNETIKAIKNKRKSQLPFIIPLIALLATSWLIYKNITQSGVEIIVNFTQGIDLKEGKTLVKYKGFDLGKVTKIAIGKDLTSVNAHIKIKKDVADLIAKEGTEFWIVQPKISVSEISNLTTVFNGVYIEARPPSISREKLALLKTQYVFKGFSEKPQKFFEEEGLNITLISDSLFDINVGTPILYKKIQTGKVTGTQLLENGVKIYLNIDNKYKHLINSSTKFYKLDALKLNANFQKGIDVSIDSLTSLISGGIGFNTTDMSLNTSKNSDQFRLYKDILQSNDKLEYFTLNIDDATDISTNTTINYKGIVIGQIENISFNKNVIQAKAYIYNKYKDFLTKKSKFFKVSASIDDFEIKNSKTIVTGSFISVEPKKGDKSDSFQLYNSYKKAFEKELIQLSLKSNKFYNLEIGSKIYFKNIAIGEILSYSFPEKFDEVDIHIGIDKKYKHLLNDKTLFYVMTTPLIESQGLNYKFNFEGFKPFIFGGIALIYTPSNKALEKNKSYYVHESYFDVLTAQNRLKEGYRVNVQLDKNILPTVGMPIVFNKTTIGFVQEYTLSTSTPYATLFIENQYKNLLTHRSKFYFKDAINIDFNLNGLKLDIGSLETLINGSVVLNNDFDEEDKSIKKPYEYKLYKGFNALPFDKYSITVNFKNIDGLKHNDVDILYKGIKVGKITDIALKEDLNTLEAKGYLFGQYKSLALSDTIFYVVKPNISLEGVEGLDTIVSGSYIQMATKGQGAVSDHFVGYAEKPEISQMQKGLKLTLISDSTYSITEGSYVYYKKIKVGDVESLDLSNDSQHILISIFIYDKYKNLVQEKSKFYNISGINVDVSLFGATIQADSLSTVIKGGIAFNTPEEPSKKVQNNATFPLYKEPKSRWLEYNPMIDLK
ncbi:MAG: MlaD family protein [Candidatus Marinarcus sp.]|uniref:MlaD family protein n=1 Tax=Candidatus Marinarcus sp. TaxID=3100987 RepID=UPI003AFF9CEB